MCGHRCIRTPPPLACDHTHPYMLAGTRLAAAAMHAPHAAVYSRWKGLRWALFTVAHLSLRS